MQAAVTPQQNAVDQTGGIYGEEQAGSSGSLSVGHRSEKARSLITKAVMSDYEMEERRRRAEELNNVLDRQI